MKKPMKREADEPVRGVRRDVAELVVSEVSEKLREKAALAKMGDEDLGGSKTTHHHLSSNPYPLSSLNRACAAVFFRLGA
jgi:hypothetical protein